MGFQVIPIHTTPSYMTEVSNIIKTKIVGRQWDAFWNDIPAASINAGNDVLVISQSFAPGSSEETQLKKMLAACNLSDGQYNMLQINGNEQVAWHKLREAAQPKIIILLGILPEQLGISAMFHLYKPNRFNDCTWIAGLSLAELEKNPDAKRQLWQEGLKPVLVDK